MLGTTEEVGINPQAVFSHRLLHMDTPVLADQQTLIFIYQLCADTT